MVITLDQTSYNMVVVAGSLTELGELFDSRCGIVLEVNMVDSIAEGVDEIVKRTGGEGETIPL